VEQKRRDDLEEKTHFRTDRMMSHDDKWYFCTREGTIQGPFEDHYAASSHLKRYIELSNSGLSGELTLVTIEPMN
jgi:hypothetical protein